MSCLDAATGKLLWQKNFLDEYKAPIMVFGASAGPLFDGNRFYLPIGNTGSCLGAFDAETAAPIWSALSDPPMGVPPTLFVPKVPGRGVVRHVIYTSTRGYIGVDPRDGQILWEFPLVEDKIQTLPPPSVVGDLVVVTSMVTGTFAFKLEDQQGKLVPKEVWRNPTVTTYFTQNIAGPNNKLYALHANLIPEAYINLCCLDLKDGTLLWQRPKVGIYQLNMIRTGDDNLLMLDDIKGDLILLDTAADDYRELARGKVCNPTIISPAIANGRVFTRDDKEISCFRVNK
jgi:outer membrane protein assembly factor BamB